MVDVDGLFTTMDKKTGGCDPPPSENETNSDASNKNDGKTEDVEWSMCLDENKKAQNQIERIMRAVKREAHDEEVVTTMRTIATVMVKATLARFSEATMDEALTKLAVIASKGPIASRERHAGEKTSTTTSKDEREGKGKPTYMSAILKGTQQQEKKGQQTKQQESIANRMQRSEKGQSRTKWYHRSVAVVTEKPIKLGDVEHVMKNYGRLVRLWRTTNDTRIMVTFGNRQQALAAYREASRRMLQWTVKWAYAPRQAMFNMGVQTLEGSPFISARQLTDALKELHSGVVQARFIKADEAIVEVDPAYRKVIWDDLAKRREMTIGRRRCRIAIFGTSGAVWKSSTRTGYATTDQNNNQRKDQEAMPANKNQDDQNRKQTEDKPEADAKEQSPANAIPDDNKFAVLSTIYDDDEEDEQDDDDEEDVQDDDDDKDKQTEEVAESQTTTPIDTVTDQPAATTTDEEPDDNQDLGKKKSNKNNEKRRKSELSELGPVRNGVRQRRPTQRK